MAGEVRSLGLEDLAVRYEGLAEEFRVFADSADPTVPQLDDLYTKERIRESLEHLTPDGVVCAQFGDPRLKRRPKRTARYLSTAREAFHALGVWAVNGFCSVVSSILATMLSMTFGFTVVMSVAGDP